MPLTTLVKLEPFNINSSASFTFANVTTTGVISGNGASLSNISGSNVVGQVSNSLVSGTVYSNAQPNITSVGTLTSLSVTNDLTVGGNLTVSGTQTTVNSTTVNINDINLVLANNATSAAQADGGGITINGANATMLYNSTANAFTFSHKISADGSLLSSLTGANVTGTVPSATSATTAATVTANAQSNITSVGTLASLSVTGLTTATGGIKTANIQDASGTVTIQTKHNNQAGDIGVVGNIVAGTGGTGNVSATYFVGNGSHLTGQIGNALIAGTVYSNAQPNITSVGTLSSLSVTANISSGSYLLGNGAFITGLPASYANADVATFLPTYTGNLSPGNISIPVGNLKISGGTSGYVLRTDGIGNLSWVAQSSGGTGGGTGASVTVSATAPTSPTEGDMWLDSESGDLNVYFGGAWGSVTATAPQLLSAVNNFTGNGVATTFTLSTTPISKEYTLVAIGGILQPRSTYSITGNVLTTSSAVPNNSPIEITILGGVASPIGAAATVISAAQPNITSTGTLVDLSVSGNLTINNTPAATTGKAIAMAIVFGF